LTNRQPPLITSDTDPAEEDPIAQTGPAGIRPGIAELLAAGLAYHQAGRLAEAEAHYRRILDAVPDHADALHLLGGLAYQTGRHEAAIALIGRAIERNASDPSYHCTHGLVLHSLNRLDEAIASYDRALVLKPHYAIALTNRGLALAALGRLVEALDSYDRALALSPDDAAALLNRGNALHRLERFAEALESYDQVLAIRPDLAEAHFFRGEALRYRGRLDEAGASYDRALALKPDFVEALINRGDILTHLGHFAEALESYEQVLAIRPDLAEAHFFRGEALRYRERLDEAVASYDRALALKPDFVEALVNRGNILTHLGHFAEALGSYDQVLAIRPDDPVALLNRGYVCHRRGRFTEALANYDRALALSPDFIDVLLNRGNTLQQLGRFGEALDSYDRVLALRPHSAEAWLNRGNALQQLGRFAEAVASYDRALTIRGQNYPVAFSNRATALRLQGQLDDAGVSSGQTADPEVDPVVNEWLFAKQSLYDWSNYRENEERARNAAKARPTRIGMFVLLLLSTPEEQLDCARRFAARSAVPASAMLPRRPPRPAGKIRLGYLSSEFREHPVAIAVAGLIEQHDRRRFEVIGYSFGPDDRSARRARLMSAFDRWVDIRDMPDRQAAGLIHGDGIDILIDLVGYGGITRTKILAYRPAPIQVNYLGYCGTMGADFIDYIIVDRFVVPTDQEAFFSERLVRLPDCSLCSDDTRPIAARTPSRAEYNLPEEGFVFCCFNQSLKITPAFFDIWMRLLAAVPESVLWLVDTWSKESNAFAKANLAREAAARGVNPKRLIFAQRGVPQSEHLARHRCADLFLDTLPFNAHSTASDALWAGLPVLTCAGNTFVGRVAGSLVHAAGLGELATNSLEEYEAVALRLARDGELLTELRERLAQNRRTSPAFDTKRYGRNLEAAYRRMWEMWQAGHPPAAFSVS
jgi:predicted O-linked N-acetylglucosamine transferase (SPINDLY family)